MSEQISLVVVSLDEYRFALPTTQVQRVLPAAAVAPLPDARPAVHGLLNLQGDLIPVLSGRLVFGIQPRPLEPAQCFVVLASSGHRFALVCDRVQGVFVVSSHDFVFDEMQQQNMYSEMNGSRSTVRRSGSTILSLSERLSEIARRNVGSLPLGVRIEGELVLICSADALSHELWDSEAPNTSNA